MYVAMEHESYVEVVVGQWAFFAGGVQDVERKVGSAEPVGSEGLPHSKPTTAMTHFVTRGNPRES